VNGIDTPIITKREAKSSVMVKDQSTIVLGGLIRENKTINDTKVPILGDIPLLGLLFKGKTTTKNRTELIVFIRPTVLRNNAAAMAEAKRRSEMLKAGAELELDKQFTHEMVDGDQEPPKPATPAPKVEPKKSEIQSQTKTAVAATPLSDRQSAKIKALKMQDGNPVAE
jgi:general secretion pathway protein D